MSEKTSIRYFNNKPVRSRWDDESSSWLICAVDFISATTSSKNPKVYWNAIKHRNPEFFIGCKQIKMKSSDGKSYLTDCLTNNQISMLVTIIPYKSKTSLLDWISGKNNPIDVQSKEKAYELIQSGIIDDIEIGTVNGLKQIHSFLFSGLYDFAGKIREKNISKDGFVFANALFLPNILKDIERMKENSLKEIIDKYIEMNIAHPFMEGNGRATRIWLDQILKRSLKKCVDWSSIDKKDYLAAMKKSPNDSKDIFDLINNALTSDYNNRELLIKGIDYSYYYEELD